MARPYLKVLLSKAIISLVTLADKNLIEGFLCDTFGRHPNQTDATRESVV